MNTHPHRRGRAAIVFVIVLAILIVMSAVIWLTLTSDRPLALGSQSTATALIQLQFEQPTLLPEEKPADFDPVREYEIFKKTQAALIKSRFVLHAAMRRPDAVRQPIVKQKDDVIEWLQSHLEVTFPGNTEIMAVSLSSRNRNEAATLVNAVVQEYLCEIVDQERGVRRSRLTQLERLSNEKQIDLRSKWTALRQLTIRLGLPTFDGETPTMTQQAAINRFLDDSKALGELERELSGLEITLKHYRELQDSPDQKETSKNTNGDVGPELTAEVRAVEQLIEKHASGTDEDSQALRTGLEELAARLKARREAGNAERRIPISLAIEELQRRIAVQREQAAALEEDIEKRRDEVEQVGHSSVDVEILRREIRLLQETFDQLAEQRERLTLELEAPPRVRLVQPAHIPRD